MEADMGKFVWDVCLMIWVVLLKHSDAEPLYFIQTYSETWDEARIECQRCFKDLATVTPNTTYIIAQNLSSDYWIGLRKHFPPLSNFTDDSDSNSSSSLVQAWSQWANGDPLAFQNWYPGWPKFKHNLPKISCCSCSCTCPAGTDPAPTSVTQFDVTNQGLDNTSYFNVTDLNTPDFNQPTISAFTPLVASQCEKSPMLFPKFPDPDQDYIEDSCVALLRNGAWVERNCSDLLPFVCYDDHFYGRASVSNVTSSGAVLTWLPAPGNVSLYRLKVTNFTDVAVLEEAMDQQPFNFTYQLENLMPGSRYHATVVAVICMRDVDDPQEVSFYTIPSKVANLTVVTQTETSITLSWNKPDVNVDFYRVQYNGIKTDTVTNGTAVFGLTPGTQYTFTVWTGVNDTSKWSDPADISAYTRPGKVADLKVVDVNSSSLHFSWTNPSGGFTGFRVMVTYNNTNIIKSYNATQSTSCATGLPPGTEINVTVTVLGNGSLEGDAVQLVSYTAPDPVSDLTLVANAFSIKASWNYSEQVYSPFSLQLQPLDSSNNITTTELFYNFTNLKTAVNYTVTVWSPLVGNGRSASRSCSIFTLPLQPTNAIVQSDSTNQLTFQWNPPANIGTGNYSVVLRSSFWGQAWNATTNQTQYTFSNLTSGSNYSFEVRTLAGDLSSDPATNSAMTVSQPVEINLAILCSSATPLYCAKHGNTEIFDQLLKRFSDKLGDGVFWKLTNYTSVKTSP